MHTLCVLSWSGRQFPLCRSSPLHEGLADRPFWLMSIYSVGSAEYIEAQAGERVKYLPPAYGPRTCLLAEPCGTRYPGHQSRSTRAWRARQCGVLDRIAPHATQVCTREVEV